ncbi:ABC transporter permease [Occallatibacter riparius]|uniref:ABC transporter permease n=1 Tax=Occallatibacter riparius TaxID=1002689 RepID=A0A9J7BIN3_9BACT|nr:ABC transporter permease [Occallatibacter riparius]UWZ81658.1 ABC transporter permease [Occallatibacter riparius]
MRNDLRFALRMIWSHRWFSAAVVVTLALGIGLNAMVFTLINAVLFKPVPVPGGARLVSVINRNPAPNENPVGMSLPAFRDYRAQSSSFEAFEAAIDEEAVLSENRLPPQPYHLQRATAGIFSMLHASPILGRGFTATDTQPGASPVAVIGYGIWKDRYGSDPNIIGRPVRVNAEPATIIGVMPEGYKFPSGVDMWIPLVPTPELEKRDNHSLTGFAILKPGVSEHQASVELDGIAHRLAAQYPADKDLSASVQTFHERYNGGGIRVIFLLMLAAVGFVLLIACANVANMMLSRALTRNREISIRTALGASRWRVVRQLLIESVVLSVLGGLAGFGLAAFGVHWFDLATRDIRPSWIAFTPDWIAFAYFAGLCIFSGLLFGTAPALRAARANLNNMLKDGARTVGRQREGWLTGTLVVFQFALTLVLLSGAGVFVRSLLASLEINPSVPATHLTTARIDLPETRYKDNDARLRFYDQLLPRLRALPGVSHAALTLSPPGMGAARQQMELEGQPIGEPGRRPWVSYLVLSPGYFETIHLPLVEGRDFNETDGASHHFAAVVTRETAAHFWPGQDPVGKRFRLFEEDNKPTEWVTVVGVSVNIVQELISNDPKPLIFVPYRQRGWGSRTIAVESSGDPTSAIRGVVQSMDPELPLRDVSTLSASLEHQTWFLRVFGKVFGTFALIGLIMASVGIYAVIAHAGSRRTQEIGVRMALGASVRNILMLVMKRGLWQIGLGLILGMALAIPAVRLLGALPFGVATKDPTVFLTVAGVLITVGIIACWLPARRAAGLDPVKALRYE